MGFLSLFREHSATPPVQEIAALSARISQIETDVKLMKLEWQETYDKVTRTFERWRKRASKLEEEKEATDAETGLNGDISAMNCEQLTRLARRRGVL